MIDLEEQRRKDEEIIAALMLRLDESHRVLLRDELKRYGSVESIPQLVWTQIREETEAELVVALLPIMVIGSSFTSQEIESQGVAVSPSTSAGVTSRSLAAARQASHAAIASVESIQRRLVHSLQQARLDTTRGSIGELTQEGIDKALQETLDEARRKTIAADETTEAITQGQREASQRAGGTNAGGQRVRIEMRWQAEIGDIDNPPCKYCFPLHEQPEEVWVLVYPRGPGRGAHRRCRCWLRAVVVVERDTEDA